MQRDTQLFTMEDMSMDIHSANQQGDRWERATARLWHVQSISATLAGIQNHLGAARWAHRVFHPPTQVEHPLHTKRQISLCGHHVQHGIVLSL